MVELSKDRRRAVRAVAALELTCTAGGSFTFAPRLVDVPVKKTGQFNRFFGPITSRNDDGTTTDVQGRISGRLNKSQTLITGISTITFTDHDAAGVVSDTCTSGSVTWKAKQ